ncbi:hypothetical protein ACX80U_12200 [Arthrobacter sp. TmT3-37]
MLNHVALKPHDQIRFGLLNGRWDVAGETRDGRYVVVTHPAAHTYQVIDQEQGFRGALMGGPTVHPNAFDGPPNDETNWILEALDGGRELALASLMPLWITDHWTSEIRGPVLDPEKLSDWACHRISHWLKANGCRWLVGTSAIVRIKGKRIELDTWTIRNRHQSRTLWPRRLPNDFEPYQKRRRFQIRVPLSTIRKA